MSPSINFSSCETAIKWPMSRDVNSIQIVYQHLDNTYIKMISKGNKNKLAMFLTYLLYEPLLITVWKLKYNYSKCMMVSAFFTEHALSHELFSSEFFYGGIYPTLLQWFGTGQLILASWREKEILSASNFFPPIWVAMNWHSAITLLKYLKRCWMEGN